MLKKIISATVAAVVLLTTGVFGYAFNESDTESSVTQAEIILNGASIAADALIGENVVYLPVRSLCEAMGYTVQWSEINNQKIVTVIKDGEKIALNLDNQSIANNGHTLYISGNYNGSGCFLYKGSTYLESGAISDNFNVSVQFDAQAGVVTIAGLSVNQISINTMTLNSEDDNLKITLQYPQIYGLENNEVQNSINAVFTKAASAAVAEGLGNAYNYFLIKEQYPDDIAKCETSLNYAVTYNQKGLLSATLYDYQYSGGAHGMTFQSSYTFDLNTGDILKLSDLMDNDSDYISYINTAIREEIDKRTASGSLIEFEESKFETIGDDPYFCLNDDSLVIYFQQYEYFPYVSGIQAFPIQFSEIGNMLGERYSFLNDETLLLEKGAQNTLAVGDLACATLDGNPTTGYSWYCTIGDDEVIAAESDDYTSNSDLIGAGGTYSWRFKALKEGQTTITFKYYRSWEGEASATAENTVIYQVNVI